MESDEFAAILKRAADLVGGIDKLGLRLGVTSHALMAWMDGTARTPVAVFLKTVDIVAEHSRAQLAADHARLMSQSRDLITRAAAIEMESIRIGHDSQVLRFAAVQMRATRRVANHEPVRLLSHRPLTVLDPAFVPIDVPNLLTEALSSALAAARTDLGNLQLVNPDGSLHIAVHRGFDTPFLDFFAVVTGGESACAVAMRERRQVLIADVASSPIFAGMSGRAMLQAGSQAVESTPIIDEPTGALMGIISTHHRTPCNATPHELALLQAIGSRTASWLEPALAARD